MFELAGKEVDAFDATHFSPCCIHCIGWGGAHLHLMHSLLKNAEGKNKEGNVQTPENELRS